MGLIDSPRLTDADRAHWARLEHYDHVLAQDPALVRAADRARKVIEEFAAQQDEPTELGVSWGKDSVVTLFLAATSDAAKDIRAFWVRQRWFENPDSYPVRDAFLARFPDISYEERVTTTAVDRWWDDPGVERQRRGGGHAPSWADRYISGVRAAESGTRALAVRVHGLASANTCRPIGRWTHQRVFALLAREDLPIHPAYAMSMGGVIDRGRLRVHSLGGHGGTYGGRMEWESRYYGEVIRIERLRVELLRLLPRRMPGMLVSTARAHLAERLPATTDEINRELGWMCEQGWVIRKGRYGQQHWYLGTPPPIPGSGHVGDRTPTQTETLFQ